MNVNPGSHGDTRRQRLHAQFNEEGPVENVIQERDQRDRVDFGIAFDAATGAIKPFVSGYHNTTLPNFWDRSAEVRATLLCQLLQNDKAKLRGFDPSRGSSLGGWLALLAAAAALVRYAGLALVGAIGLDTLRAHRQASIGRRLRNALLTMLLPVGQIGRAHV